MLPPPFITDTYKFPVFAVNVNVLHFHRTFHSKSALLPLVAALLAATAHAETIISNPETELAQGQNTVQGIQINKYQSGQGIKIHDDILYVAPENWTSGDSPVATTSPVISIIGNAQPIAIKNPTTESASLVVQGYMLTDATSSGLITLGELGDTPSKGRLELSQGDLTVRDSSSTSNIVSIQGAGNNSSNRVGAQLKAQNIHLSNLEADDSLIFVQGSERYTSNNNLISEFNQSAILNVTNNDNSSIFDVQNTIADSAITAHTGVSVEIDRIRLKGNTFRDAGISIGRDDNIKNNTTYRNHFEVFDTIFIEDTTVNGIGETGNFEGFALRKTNASIVEDASGFTQPSGEAYPWKGTALSVDGITVLADRERVSGVFLANNTFSNSKGNQDYPALFMTVSDIKVSDGVDVSFVEGIHFEGNAPKAEGDNLIISGTVTDIAASNSDIVGITLKDNFDSAENRSAGGTSYVNLTVDNLSSANGHIIAIAVDQTNRQDEITHLWDVNVSNLTSDNDTIGLDINNASVSIGDIDVEANYALKANRSEIILGEEQDTSSVNSKYHEFVPTSVHLKGRVDLSDSSIEFASPVKESHINGTLSLGNGSSAEIYQKLFIVSDIAAQGTINGYKDALVIGNVEDTEQSVFEFTQYASSSGVDNQRALYLSTQGYTDQNYKGHYASQPSDEETIDQVALRVNANGLADFTNAANVQIYGTIVAGRGGQDDSANAGIIDITRGKYFGSKRERNVVIKGDVYAGNGGQITMALEGSNSLIEGQIDDYWELDSVKKGEVFRNSAFKDADGNTIDVSESGHVDLTLKDGAQWLARGQSFITDLTFEGQNNLVDLSQNTNSSVVIKNLTGDGTFRMKLGKPVVDEATGEVHSDMLYIQNMADDAKYTIDVTLDVNINELNGLRFATTNTTSNLDNFVLKVNDQGFFNRTLTIQTEDYSAEDTDNKYFDGQDNGTGSYKPGESAIGSLFGDQDSTNWYFGDPDAFDPGSENPDEPTPPGGDSSISDAGQAIIATARALYYNAIEIDRFNQRYGDRRYDENNKSLWARVRQDRWGTAAGVGDFKSQNTTYQIGFDYTRPSDSGKMIFGAAVDLMDGNTDYESIDGSGETKRYAVSAYATYLGDNGGYVDVVGKVGRLSNEYAVKLDSGAGVSADYMNWMAGISVEVGHQLSTDNSRWFFEPQMQAQYVFVSDNDYSNGQTEIEQDSIHSFITRAGFRAGRWFGEQKNANVYFKTDVMHEWAGEQEIHVTDNTTAIRGDTISINNHGTWFDVGLGFQAPVGKSFYAYGDAEYRFGNDLDQTWVFNFGGKYVF